MLDLDATVERHDLPLAAPFGISRGTTERVDVVSIELADAATDADRVGIGAASPSAYYGEDADTVEAALPELLALLASVDAPLEVARGGAAPEASDRPDISRVETALREARPADAAARAALSIALHDLAAKREGLPLFRLWGLAPDGAPPTSYTIGLDEPATMAERADAATDRGFDHLKVKLGADGSGDGSVDGSGDGRGDGSVDGSGDGRVDGGGDGRVDGRGDGSADSGDAGRPTDSSDDPLETHPDVERLAAVREAAPDATLRVDANGAWERDLALELLPVLERRDVELLEQPVAAEDVDALRAVTERASVPVAADEACVDADDVAWVADACDVVVCKATKCGGLAAARRQVAAARWHDLDVMLGCAVESSASIAGSWHLAPAVEYVDLDGNLLLAEDPYEWLELERGRAPLADQERAGTGARRTD